MNTVAQRKEGRARTLRLCRKHLPFYVFLLLPLIQVIVFNYFPDLRHSDRIQGLQDAPRHSWKRMGLAGAL